MKAIGNTSSGKSVLAAYPFHGGKFSDWTVKDHHEAAALHRKIAQTDIPTNRSMHQDAARWHEDDARRIQALAEKLGLVSRAVGNKGRQHATRRASSRQLDRDISEVLSKKSGARVHATRIAYRLKLTPSELRAIEFARGRYAWPDMLSAHATEDGSVAFSESEMWQWTDDVDSDDAPFPLAAPALAAKLQRFYDERV